MSNDNKTRNGIFALAVVGLIVASTAGSVFFKPTFEEPNINVNTDFMVDKAWDEASFVSEQRSLATFHEIKVLGGVQITLVAGGEQSVMVEAHPENMKWVKTWVEEGVLVIDTKNENRRYQEGMTARLTIQVANFDGITVEGAIDGSFSNIESDDFGIHVEGASNMHVEGACQTVTITMEGASNIEADDLTCKNADITMAGVGNIEAFASERVNVSLDGVGSIDVKGGATDVTKRKGGFGNIEIR